MRPGVLVVLVASAVLGWSSALAEWTGYVPRPTRNGIYLDIFAAHERDDYPQSTLPYGWTDTFIREKLTLYTNGYVYHPRFLQYQLSLSGALKQEDYDATYLDSAGWRHGTGYEYDVRTLLLPEHPYNLELYALRYEPLFKEQAATERNSLQTNWGGLFRYRRKPWFLNTRYNNSETRSGIVSSSVERFGVDGQYFMRYRNGNQFSLNAAFNPSWFSNSSGLDGTTTEYLFGNLVDLQRARLSSSLTRNRSDQEIGGSGKLETDQISWYELLNMYFPGNVRSIASYRIQNNESKIPETNAPGRRTLSDIYKIFQLDVIHRLYQSLDTVYTFKDSNRTSSAGETDYTSNSLSLSYNKLIHRGRVLLGTNVGRDLTESQGTADIVNESHAAVPVPGSFSLGQPNVEPASILVFLRSPLPPFDLVTLVENVHYTVTTVANTLDINVLTLPPQFAVPGTYDFSVTYSLAAGDFRLRADLFGYNASVELLDTMLIPYYNYASIRSEVLSGVFPGAPLDSTTHTLGLRFQRGPWRALGEYQDLEWEVSPYRARRAEVQYISSVSPTLRVYATGSYLNKRFPRGTSTDSREAYTDETLTASGNVQKQLPIRNFLVSAGGSYTRLGGRVEGDAYSVTASLDWKVGKMNLSAGASAYSSETQGTTGILTSRFHQYYFINLRRVFF